MGAHNAEAKRLARGGAGDDAMVPRSPPRGGRTGGENQLISSWLATQRGSKRSQVVSQTGNINI